MVIGSSGSLTLNQGTANGVAYLNGSKVVTSGSALTFDGTNLTLGGYGRTTGTGWQVLNNGLLTSYGANASGTLINNLDGGPIQFQISSSEQMRLTSTGLGIGTSSPAALLNLSSGSGTKAIWSTTRNIGGVNRNWQIAVDEYAEGQFTITPSTTLGGTTFTTPAIRLDTSGNLGLGVTPSSISSSGRALQVRSFLFEDNTNGYGIIRYNNYFNGTQDTYLNTGAVSAFQMQGNAFKWYQAPSGTAGNAITFTQAMTLDASGNLGIGTTSPAAS
jgi:hypothetical protein